MDIRSDPGRSIISAPGLRIRVSWSDPDPVFEIKDGSGSGFQNMVGSEIRYDPDPVCFEGRIQTQFFFDGRIRITHFQKLFPTACSRKHCPYPYRYLIYINKQEFLDIQYVLKGLYTEFALVIRTIVIQLGRTKCNI